MEKDKLQMLKKDLDGAIEALGHRVIGAAIEVHRECGPGLSECIYEDAFACELELQGIPFQRQVDVPVFYKGRQLRMQRLDLLVAGVIVVELKASAAVLDIHRAQLLNYLRLTNLPLGFLFNFNVTWLREGMHRLINERALDRKLDIFVPPSRPSSPLRDLRVHD